VRRQVGDWLAGDELVGNEHAAVAVDDGIVTVTITRPDKLGAITPEVTAVLWDAVMALGDRSDLRALIITGTGRYFTAGIDVTTPAGCKIEGDDRSAVAFRRSYRHHHLLYDEMEAVEKPIIIAANGTSIGAGLEMAVSCDFRFCTPETRWGLPEIRMATVPGSGGTSRLTRIVGPHWARWIAMAGEQVSAEDARMMGLVHAIHPAETLLDEVNAFARRITALYPEAVGLAKLAIDLCVPQDRTGARHIERMAVTQLRFDAQGWDWYQRYVAEVSAKKAPPTSEPAPSPPEGTS
jgi:enoyl-CoA hydratase/carnithine racemase